MPKRGNKKRKKGRTGAGPSKGLRLCQEEEEQYGVVARVLGGPNCLVVCHDGKTRMCVIRNKFRWRNKQHNRVSPGTWVMVGVRAWESTASGEQKCDLLEVYSDGDVIQLRRAADVDLAVLENATCTARPGEGAAALAQHTEVVFTDEPEPDPTATPVVAVRAATFGDDDDEIDLDSI
jgi:initiation factor 1A